MGTVDEVGGHGYIDARTTPQRLRQIEGQARGLQRMVEDDKYCIDILNQVSTTTRALQSVGSASSKST